MIDRRGFLVALLAQTVFTGRLLAAGAPKRLHEWVRAHDELSRKLRTSPAGGIQWMRGVEELSAAVDLDEVLRAIDFPKIEREFEGIKHSLRVPGQGRFGVAIFRIDAKHPITPHGHRNMASAHLLIDGKVRVRNFDRVADEPEHLILRPTVDTAISRGAVSTMSSQRNNIHWFTALTERAFTLDVVVDGLAEGDEPYYIDLVDPAGGTRRGDGTIRATRIDWKTSVRLYT
jgi:hypothetical protein